MRITTLVVPAADREVAADRLWTVGARAVEERDGGDGSVELRTSLGGDIGETRRRIGSFPETWTLGIDDVDPTPAETWREFATPMPINDRLVIVPAWHGSAGGDDPAASGGHDLLTVSIEPGGSFGLGDHPTTRLSADAVDRLVRPGDRVLDVGCGSGVLGIIAARRGASGVVATDIASEAVVATEDNARRNGVAGRISATTDALTTIEGVYDLVVANILAPTLIDLAFDLQRLTSPSGRLVISGVIDGRYGHVIDALRPMKVVERRLLEGWVAIELRHSGAVGSAG